jgi:hypothetical protein
MGGDLVDAVPLRQAGHVDLVIEVTDVAMSDEEFETAWGTHNSWLRVDFYSSAPAADRGNTSKPLPEDSRSVRSSEAATAAHRVQFGPEYFIGAAD